MRVVKWAVLLSATIAVGPPLPAVTIIKSSAQAWIWARPDVQESLLTEMRDYAQRKSLQFYYHIYSPPPWRSLSVLLKTPGGNRINLMNVGPSKMSVGIIVLNKDEDWQTYWNDLRAYLSAEHKWEDVP